MAFTDLIMGKSSRATIGGVTLDASIGEDHTREAEITDHPVEEGSDITDNYRADPKSLSIEGQISNVPLGTTYPGQSTVNSIKNTIKGDDDPVTSAWKELNRFFDEKVVIDIETSLESYANMMLTSLTPRRDATSGDVLRFTATAREVIFVETQVTAAIALVTKATGQEKKSRGKQTNKDASAQQERDVSAARKLLEGGGIIP